MLAGPQREPFLRQLALGNAESMPDLAEEIGLTDEQTREMLYLMMDHTMRPQPTMRQEDIEAMNSDPERRRRFAEQARAVQAEAEALVAARFGQSVVDKYKAYQTTVGPRTEIREFQLTLVDRDMPLSAEQRRQLTTALAQVDSTLQNQGRKLWEQGAMTDAERVARNFDMMNERYSRVDSEVAAILTPAQRALWDKWSSAKREQNALQQQLFRERQAFESEAQARTQPPSR